LFGTSRTEFDCLIRASELVMLSDENALVSQVTREIYSNLLIFCALFSVREGVHAHWKELTMSEHNL
jgi:hypothetical protein